MKTVAETLGVARSSLVKRLAGGAAARGAYAKAGDPALLARVRSLVDRRPTYEMRFDSLRAPHQVEFLTDNASAYTAQDTRIFAAQLGLVPCFTPVASPESNGIAEAFVRTFKRDYLRVNPVPSAESALSQIAGWGGRLQRDPSSLRAAHALAPRVQTRPTTSRGVRLNRGNNTHWFLSLADAREKLEAWRSYYNEDRPHGTIGHRVPMTLHNSDGAASPPS